MIVAMTSVMILVMLAALTQSFGSDFTVHNAEKESYMINSSSCSRPCHVFICDGDVTVDCRNAGCTELPSDLRYDTTRLIMAKNKLQNISSKSFDSLWKLVYLDLSHCSISWIEYGSFDHLQKLQFLNISYNKGIKDLPRFSKLSSLKELHLKRTQSSCIFEQRLFLNLEKLEAFSFDGNELNTFPKFLSRREKKPLFRNLRILSLARNNIREIKESIFRGLEDNLEILNLIENRIHVIRRNAFFAMSKLRVLYLDRNRFRIIECDAFRTNSLEFLSITNSDFSGSVSSSKCQHDILQNVTSLKSLNLTSSTGFRFAMQPFSSQKSLQELNLQDTHMTKLDLRRITRALPKLVSLKLFRNEITSLSPEMFSNITLEYLNVGKNWITTINATSFPPRFWKSLKRIDFSGNPFYCDCNLIWFRQWIRRENITLEHSRRTKCSGPPSRNGQVVEKLVRPTALECFTVDSDWILLTTFLISVAICLTTTFVSFLHKHRWYIRYWIFKTKSKLKHFQELLDETDYAFDAFVSYSESDNSWVVRTLCQKLEDEFHLNLCVHHRDWMIGRDIVSNIVDSIERSRKTLMIVSNAFAASQWCHFEMTMVQTKLLEDDRDNLILVLLEEVADCNMNPRLQLQMQRKTYIEWTENPMGQQLFWEKLRQALSCHPSSIMKSTPPRALFSSFGDNFDLHFT